MTQVIGLKIAYLGCFLNIRFNNLMSWKIEAPKMDKEEPQLGKERPRLDKEGPRLGKAGAGIGAPAHATAPAPDRS